MTISSRTLHRGHPNVRKSKPGRSGSISTSPSRVEHTTHDGRASDAGIVPRSLDDAIITAVSPSTARYKGLSAPMDSLSSNRTWNSVFHGTLNICAAPSAPKSRPYVLCKGHLRRGFQCPMLKTWLNVPVCLKNGPNGRLIRFPANTTEKWRLIIGRYRSNIRK